jgi:hypothetical protein
MGESSSRRARVQDCSLARARVRARVRPQSAFTPRGVGPRLSLRYALAGICLPSPPAPTLLLDGVARRRVRRRGCARARAEVIIFRFMYKCFSGERADRGCVLLVGMMPIVKFRGELKNALEAFARPR